MNSVSPPLSLEAKLVVLGFQGVGKTSLVHRFVKNDFIPTNQAQSTVGASFLTTSMHDPESGTTIRLQIWDTAGQERFRSISRLYYRGANAAILAYDITSKKSFDEMAVWLQELKDNCADDLVIHVVGTKMDVVAAEPQKREVPLERCIGYVAEQLSPDVIMTGSRGIFRGNSISSIGSNASPSAGHVETRSSDWTNDTIFDFCHEISARDGEGIDEVFRVITRKLVEQHSNKVQRQKALESLQSQGGVLTGDAGGSSQGYFDLPKRRTSSFRIGYGDKRRSWLGLSVTPAALMSSDNQAVHAEVSKGMKQGKCC